MTRRTIGCLQILDLIRNLQKEANRINDERRSMEKVEGEEVRIKDIKKYRVLLDREMKIRRLTEELHKFHDEFCKSQPPS